MRGYRLDGGSLRDLREQAGLSLAELAERIQCKPSFVRNLEKGPDQPSRLTAFRITRALSRELDRPVTIEDLFSVDVAQAEEVAQNEEAA